MNVKQAKPSIKPMTPATVQHLLDCDQKACENLLALFAAERQFLKEREIEPLDEVIRQKNDNLKLLEASANQRMLWVSTTQIKDQAPEEVWEKMLGQLSPKLVQQWQGLKECFVACQRENEINGKLLARKEETYSKLLNIVRGQHQQQDLYTAKGAKGQKSKTTYGQNLGRA